MRNRFSVCLTLAAAVAAAALFINMRQGSSSPDIPSAPAIPPDAEKREAFFTRTTPPASGSAVLLVNGDHPLPEDYEPGELVNLYEQKRHFQLASSEIFLEKESFEAANRMFEQAEKDGVNGFILTSGYRSAQKQAEVYSQQQDGTAAQPGYSEHQTGLAFDVTARRDDGGFESTRQFEWLSEHCWEYGFILRYPEGREHITGTPYEPWHYRYVGVEIAQAIHANGWTLEEYCAS